MYHSFSEYLQGQYITSEEVLSLLCDAAEDSNIIKDSVIVFDEFTGFTPIQNQLLRKLLVLSERIIVSVTMDAGEDFYHCIKGAAELLLTNGSHPEVEIDKVTTPGGITIKGLNEMEDYDPFEHIIVSFSGTSPDTTINITNNTGIEDLEFEADKYEKLKLGDTVTVTAKGYYDEDPAELCAYEGKNLTVTSKEYTVENVPKYADQLSEIPQDMLDKMDQNAQDKLNAYAANNWSDEERLVGISLEGEYFLYVKDGADTYDYWSGESTYNKLFLVYKVSVEADGKPYEYYYYSRFSNIIIMEDGTCSLDMSAIATPDDTISVDGYYYYNGYADLDTLKYKTVTANLDNYTYEEKFD